MKNQRRHFLLYPINAYQTGLILYLFLRFGFGDTWWWLALLNTFALWLFLPLVLLVPLAFLLRGRKIAFSALILALIGFFLFAPLPQNQSSESQDLRVLSFNVLGNNPYPVTTSDWILAQDADILVLSEFVGSHQNEIPRILAQYPYQVFVEGSVRLFSRYPFRESSIVTLLEPSTEHKGRWAVRAVIEREGQAVTIYGVHLSLPIGNKWRLPIHIEEFPYIFFLRYDETYRNQQIRNLANLIAQETNPVILAGDFNTSHSSLILDELRHVGMVDSFAAVGQDWGMTWPYLGNLRPMIRIDYVWASPSIRPLRFHRSDYLGSDHLALLVDFALGD